MKNLFSISRLLVAALAMATGGLRPAQAQGVQWASGQSNSAFATGSTGAKVAVDAAGNTYVVGTGGNSARIGGLLPAAQVGTGNLFVLKRDPAGQVLWLMRTASGATPLGLGLDGAGNIVVSGTFSTSATFGAIGLTSAGGTDGFVARMSPAGTWLTAVRLGGAGNDLLNDLDVRPDGTAYVTGSFLQTATFGPLTLSTATGTGSFDTDVFVARLSPANAWQWATRAGNAQSQDVGQGLAVDGAGRVTVTGAFSDTCTFGSLGLTTRRTGSPQTVNTDLFVAQLNAVTGTWQWATRAGGPSKDEGLDVAVDAAGFISLAGDFVQPMDFGDSLALPPLTGPGGLDVLVARLSPTGTWLWATSAGGTTASSNSNTGDKGFAVAVDPAGTRTTVAGLVSGDGYFGPSLPPLTAARSALAGTFVAQVANTDGHWLNAVVVGSAGINACRSVALSADGQHVYMAGRSSRTVYFGNAALSTNDGLSSVPGTTLAGLSALLVAARLAPDTGTWDQVLDVNQGGSLEVTASAHDAAGNTYVAGRFGGALEFATAPLPTRLTSSGAQDAFVGKLDAQGRWLWLRQGTCAEPTRDEAAQGIGVDAAGRVTVMGYFQHTAFGLGGLTVAGQFTVLAGLTNLANQAGSSVWVAQLDAATGTPQWLRSLSSRDAIAFGLSLDPASGEATVAGSFQGTVATTGGGTFSATATGYYDGFLARIGTDGTWRWLARAGAATPATGSAQNNVVFGAVEQDASGAYTVSGAVQGTCQLGTVALPGNPTLAQYYPFIARLDAAGAAWAWAQVVPQASTYSGSFNWAKPDAAGNVYWPLGTGGLRYYTAAGALGWQAAVATQAVAPDAAGEATILGTTSSSPTTVGGLAVAGIGKFAAHLTAAGLARWVGPLGANIPSKELELLEAEGTLNAVGLATAVPVAGGSPVAVAVVARLLAPPVIVSFTPGTGNIGTVVVLTGTGFTNATAVAFNGVNAPGFVVSNGGTTIAVSAPLGVSTGPITVTSAGGTGSSATPFVVPAAATAVAWTGAVDTRWELAGNWNPAVVPAATTDVTIPPVPNQPLVTTPAACATLTSQFGSTLSIAAPGYLVTAGNVAVYGTFSMSGGTLEAQADLSFQQSFTATGGLVLLLGTGTQHAGSSSGVSQFWNVTLAPGATRAEAIGDFRIQRVLTLHRDLDVGGLDYLTLESNTAGTGMVVNAGGVLQGGVRIQRYIGGPNAGLGYRHFSVPVLFGSIGNLYAPGYTPVLNAAYNTVGTTARPFPNFFGFDEARQGAAGVPGPVGFDQGWESPASGGNLLAVGRGFTVNTAGTLLFTAQGTALTGPIAVGPLSRSGTGAFAGYHLLGNPYPSPIDWDNVAKPTGLDNAVYVFRSSSQYGGAYDYYVNGVGTLAGGEIAAMQGFFVRVSQPVPSFTFTDAARLTTYANPTYQRGTADARPTLALTLRPASGPAADKTFVYFEAGATAGLDGYYDAPKLPNSDGLALASQLGGQAYAVNGLPLLGPAPLVLPLTVQVPAAGSYELATEQFANFAPGTTLYLRDALLNTLTPLTAHTRYAFILAGTSAPGRFSIEFRPAGTLASAVQVLEAQVAVWPNPATGGTGITVAAPAGAVVCVFSALGQQVRPAATVGAAALALPTAGLAAGLYVLRVRTGAGEVSRRLVVE